MPEHFHLLISEPSKGNPSTVMQLLKQRTAARFNRDRGAPVGTKFWQARFYDFNVYTHDKRVEKISYMHENPMKRGLVADPLDWEWSSCRFYRTNEVGQVLIEFEQ
jgi:putative transposase